MPLIFEAIFCLLIVVFFLNHYSSEQPLYVLIISGAGIFLALLIIPLALHDIYGSVPEFLWILIYWINLGASWIIIPFAQAYSCSGAFSFLQKSRDALLENILFYGILTITGSLVAIFLKIVTWGGQSLSQIIKLGNNITGMGFMIVAMGHGLIRVPRILWQDHRRALIRAQALLPSLARESEKATILLKNLLEEAKTKLYLAPPELYYETDYLKNIITACTPQNMKLSDSSLTSPHTPSIKQLEQLNAKLLSSKVRFDRASYRLTNLKSKIKFWESHSRNWHGYAKDVIKRFFSLICITLSTFVIIGELRGRFPSKLFLIAILLVYMSTCVFVTMMRIKFFSYYMLVPKHTDAKSLLFYGSFLCRLFFPLAYNVISLTEFYDKTIFVKVIGHLGFHQITLCLCLMAVCLISYKRWHVSIFQKYFDYEDDYAIVEPDHEQLLLQQYRAEKTMKNMISV